MTLRDMREAAGLTQVAAAERAGLTQSMVSALELGKHPNPGIDTLERIASAYGRDLDAVIGALRASVGAAA